MDPGATEDLLIAIVWARGSNNLDSVSKLRPAMQLIQSLTDYVLTPTLVPIQAKPSQLAYAENAPNPFDDRTVIRYSVPEPQPVRLMVYDMLGREVATLVDGIQPKGEHEAVFEARDVPPGVYIYRISIGRATATGRMVRR